MPAPTVSSTISRHLPVVDTAATDTLIRLSDSQQLLNNITRCSEQPLVVGLPNQATISSIAVGTVQLPQPASLMHPLIPIQGHIFPDDQLDRSLFSVADYCNQGCTATFTRHNFEIKSPAGHVVLRGFKHPNAKLWPVQVNKATQPSTAPTFRHQEANAVVRHELNAEFVAFCHAALGNPTNPTFLAALRKGYLSTWPRLTYKTVAANLPASIATAKGHLDLTRQGQKSTKPAAKHHASAGEKREQLAAELLSSLTNQEQLDDNAIFTRIIQLEHDDILHADATSRFPVPSYRNNNYMLIAVYRNYVKAVAMKDRSAESYVAAHRTIRNFFVKHGTNPSILRMDNETSSLLEEFASSVKVSIQYVPPQNHRANKAERAIRDFKNHFIATLATVHPTFPVGLWDELIPQVELTLNLLRPSALDANISAFHGIYGYKYDFTAHPLAPCGTSIVIYNSPAARKSWSPHGEKGYYLGPALDHYRSFRVYSITTKTTRVSDTLAWFPAPFKLPGSSTHELLIAAIDNLTAALKSASQHDDHATVNMQPESMAAQHASAEAIASLRHLMGMYSSPLTLDPSIGADSNNTTTDGVQGVDGSNRTAPPASHAPGHIPDQIQGVVSPPGLAALHQQQSQTDSTNASTTSNGQQQQPRRRSYRQRKLPARLCDKHFAYLARQTQLECDNNVALEEAFQQYAAQALNLDEQGKALTFKNVMKGPNADEWMTKTKEEYVRLIDETKTLRAIHRSDQPVHRRKDTTYVKHTVREKRNRNGTIKRRVRAVAGGNLINYPFKVSARTAEMETFKLLMQAAASARKLLPGSGNICTMDIKDFYIQESLLRPEYVSIHIEHIPPAIIQKYNYEQYIYNNHILFEVNTCMYGLPQAGLLSQEGLFTHLEEHGYRQHPHIPCLFKHDTLDIIFVLTVDDFAVKYGERTECEHLVTTLKKKYEVDVDWTGSKYLGFTIEFDDSNHSVSLSMPDYVPSMLHKFFPGETLRGAKSPAVYFPPAYGSKAQQNTTVDDSPPLDVHETKRLQEIIGNLLFYARGVDYSILPAVNHIASLQAQPTNFVMGMATRLLNYLASYPSHKLVFKACDMVLRIHSDASHHSRSKARSVAGGFFFCGNIDSDDAYINGGILAISSIIPTVCASAAESEYAALFLNGQQAVWLRLNLEAIGYPQSSPTPMVCDNACAVGLAQDTVKIKRAKTIDMRYHWVKEKVQQGVLNVYWKPGVENFADYFTKAQPVHVHQRIKSRYVSFTPNPTNPSLSSTARRMQAHAARRVYTATINHSGRGGVLENDHARKQSSPNSS